MFPLVTVVIFGNLCDQYYKQISNPVNRVTKIDNMVVMPTDVKKSFAAWLEQTFLKWQVEKGKRASLQEFADDIGYSRPLISMWLSGQRLPGEDGIARLAALFGPEVYDVLDIPRPNQYLQKINQVFERLTPEHQQKLAEDAERYGLNNDAANTKRTSKQRKTSSNQ